MYPEAGAFALFVVKITFLYGIPAQKETHLWYLVVPVLWFESGAILSQIYLPSVTFKIYLRRSLFVPGLLPFSSSDSNNNLQKLPGLITVLILKFQEISGFQGQTVFRTFTPLETYFYLKSDLVNQSFY